MLYFNLTIDIKSLEFMKMCEYIGNKVNDDLPNQPFIYHQSDLVGDDWFMVKIWLEIITL